MSAALKSEVVDGTLVLSISNPTYRNALDPSMYAAGVEALNAAESARDVACVVLTGEGPCFSSGGNLVRLSQSQSKTPADRAADVDGLHAWVEAIRTFPKPVIACVEGVAAGAGFSLALACDLIVAGDSSLFKLAHVNVGLSPGGGATWHLMNLLPRAIAMQLMLTGATISAKRLHDLGVVTQLAPDGQALRTSLALAATLAQQSGAAMGSIKELANDVHGATLSEHMQAEKSHFLRHLAGDDAKGRMVTFLEKWQAHTSRP